MRRLSLMRLLLVPAIVAASGPPLVQNLAATDITTSSITITYTEDDFYNTEISIHPPAGELINPGNRGNRTFRGLESGQLYSFVAVTVDPVDSERRSEPVAINQDTVPPKPASLELSTFEVLTVEVTFFGSKVPHRIDTSGILAEWSEPGHGNCDCYQANIGPNEGLQIEPKDEAGELNPGEKSRQFIHLVPGKLYEVEIWSTSCGNGEVGPLTSEKLIESIRVPPQSPGRVKQKGRGGDYVEMCFQGPAQGHFTGFEISWQSNDGNTGQERFDVHGHSEEYAYQDYDRNYCYTLEGLRSCTPHQVQIRTVYEDAVSTDNTKTRFETLPLAPINVQLKNYEDDSIDLVWDNPGDALGYTVNVKPSDMNYTITNAGFRMEGLQAGQRNDFEIKSYCMMTGDRKGAAIEYKLFSNPATFSQTTIPESPASATGLCRVGKSSVDLKKDNQDNRFAATVTQEIILDLDWEVPESGIWDGFIVTYSPFAANPDDPAYIPPFTYGAGRTHAKINLPRTDQEYTVYIRSVAGNIESEPMIINVECGEPSPVLSCSQKPAMLQNIDLNGGNVEINLDHLALSDNLWGNLFSADDPFGPRLEFGGSGGKTIIIRSDNLKCNEIPCDTVKMNFNVCTSGFGCQERFTASACPCSNPDKQIHVPVADAMPVPIGGRSQPRPGHVMADACCGTKLYNSEEKVCCHDELFEKEGSEMCCGSQKYDKKLYHCCGADEGFGLAFIGASCNDATFLPGQKF